MANIHIRDYAGKHIHFVGVGGSSMSGLAHILLSRAYRVSGSDLKSTSITHHLQEEGLSFHQGHKAEYVEGSDLVVHTAAVKDDNPEIIRARELSIPVIDRAELLGQIMEQFPYAIGVSGTHGKTTTTSMISIILEEGGLDPTIHIGGELKIIGGSTKVGDSPYFVTEACEYVESFLKFHPTIAVVLNIDADHLDYFKDMDHIYQAFYKYVSLVPKEGYCVANGDDPLVRKLLDSIECNIVTFGTQTSNDWYAENIHFNELGYPSFTAMHRGDVFGSFELSVPGVHNVLNALAAIATAALFDVPADRMGASLKQYTGAKRRFERQGSIDGVSIIHDYAHHPTEIAATLKAASMLPHKRLWCVFQPHLYSRTKLLFEQFAGAFIDADELIITDIYAAREKDGREIHARDLVKAIQEKGQGCHYIQDFDSIVQYLQSHWQPGDVVITLGAGDINKIGQSLLGEQEE